MVEQDYVMRIIKDTIKFIARLLYNRKDIDWEEVKDERDEKLAVLYEELKALIDKNLINQAENLLYERIEEENLEYFEMALAFYSYLNKKDGKELEAADYSREEIQQGIIDLSKTYGLPYIEDITDKL